MVGSLIGIEFEQDAVAPLVEFALNVTNLVATLKRESPTVIT